MAEASISEDHFMCSVCLDLLKDPVTVPCGHTYCMRCITDCWNQEDQTRIYSCPQCRQTFSPRPVLAKNVMFAEMMEKLKKTKVKCAVSDQCSSGAGDVECDVCTGRKHKAIKSCLLCLNSYCQTHLEQHENLFRGKRHNLIDATAPLHDMICPQHDKILEIYCRTDQKLLCVLCIDEHKDHETISTAAAWTEKQSQFGETKNKVQQQIQKKQKDLQKIKDVVESHKRCAQTAVEHCEMMFTELISSIERRRSEVTQLIRDQETAAVSSAEGLLERLKQEIDDLRRRDAELEKLLHTQHHIHVLQSLSSLSVPPGSTDSLSSITVSSLLSFDDVITSVSHLRDKLERLCTGELEKISERGLVSCGQSLSDRPLQITSLTRSRPSASISGFDEKFKPAAGSWTCDTCLVRNMSSDKICPSCLSPRLNIDSDSDSKPAVATASLRSLFAPSAGSWTCDTCLIINKPEVVKCVCCVTAKPGTQANSSLISPFLTKASSYSSSTTITSTGTGLLRFGDKCKAPEESWDCDVCLVHNNAQDVKCIACETPKPGAEAVPVTYAPASTPGPLLGLRHKFKTPEGSWECEVCCVLNKAEDQNCVACQSKPKAKIQFRGDSSFFGVQALCSFIALKPEKDDAPESSETILNTTTSAAANTIPVECQPGDPKFECRQDHLTGPPSPSFAFGKSVEAKVSSLSVFGQKPTPAPIFGSTAASSAQGIFEGGFGATSEVWAGSAAPLAPAVSPVPVPFSLGQTPASNILSSEQNSSKDGIAGRKIRTVVRRRK